MIIPNHKILSDITLKHTPWLEVIISSENESEIIDNFNKILQSKIALMKSKNIRSLHLITPINWTKLHQQLEKLGWLKTLITLQKNLLNPQPDLPIPSGIKLTSHVSNLSDILNLLKEQAGYHSHFFPFYYKSINEINWELYSKELSLELKDKSTLALVAFVDNHPAGFIQGEYIDNQLNIYELVVDSRHQRRGIGSILLNTSINLAYKKGVMKVSLETFWNQPALNFYLKHDFSPKYKEYIWLID